MYYHVNAEIIMCSVWVYLFVLIVFILSKTCQNMRNCNFSINHTRSQKYPKFMPGFSFNLASLNKQLEVHEETASDDASNTCFTEASKVIGVWFYEIFSSFLCIEMFAFSVLHVFWSFYQIFHVKWNKQGKFVHFLHFIRKCLSISCTKFFVVFFFLSFFNQKDSFQS